MILPPVVRRNRHLRLQSVGSADMTEDLEGPPGRPRVTRRVVALAATVTAALPARDGQTLQSVTKSNAQSTKIYIYGIPQGYQQQFRSILRVS